MDIPSPFEGIVEEIKVKVGDQVKEGIEIIVITASENVAEKSQEKEVQKKEVTSSKRCIYRYQAPSYRK